MKQVKYKFIGAFAVSVGLSRSGAFKALEANDEIMWGKYAAFLEARHRKQMAAVQTAKARVLNAIQI